MPKKKIQSKQREKEIPEYKLKTVQEIADKIKKNRTLLIASTKGLPSAKFHEIKKNLRSKAEIRVVKKNLMLRAIDAVKILSLNPLKDQIKADIALFFSNEEPFVLSGILADNLSPTKARTGDVAPEDIVVEPGPTDLPPGPAISELSGVGLKVAVEGGKLAIKLQKVVVKQGEIIKDNVASVLGKLNINPMKVGFEPIAAFDRQENKVYLGIKIDKKGTLENLRMSIAKSFSFAVNMKYVSNETIKYFITRAALEEKAMSALVDKSQNNQPQGG